MATANDSLSCAPFRLLSQKYVFLKSSDVGSPRIAFTIHVKNGLSLGPLDGVASDVFGLFELRPDRSQRSILTFNVIAYCV